MWGGGRWKRKNVWLRGLGGSVGTRRPAEPGPLGGWRNRGSSAAGQEGQAVRPVLAHASRRRQPVLSVGPENDQKTGPENDQKSGRTRKRTRKRDATVRRAKVSIFSGWKSHPATVAPAGSNRSGDGGNEI